MLSINTVSPLLAGSIAIDAPRSFGNRIFTRFHLDPVGEWKDWGFRFSSEAEALAHGRKLLNRIVSNAPRGHGYLDVDPAKHVTAFESDDPVNTGDLATASSLSSFASKSPL